MKRNLFLRGVLVALVSGTMFWSCEKEVESFENDLTLKKASAQSASTINYSATACVGESHLFTLVAPTGANLQVQAELAPGVWTQIFQVSSSVVATNNFSYVFTAPGTVNIRYKVGGGGYTTSTPVVVENCGCETTLRAVTSCDEAGNRTATFTLTVAEAASFKLQGGLTNFTAELYTVVASTGTVSTKIPGNSSNRVITVGGEVEACETVTVTVSWNSTNGGDSITGDWSVELNGQKALIVDAMACDQTKTGYAPVAE